MALGELFGIPYYIGTLQSHLELVEAFKEYVESDDYFHKPTDWDATVDTSFGHPRNSELPWQLFMKDVATNHLGAMMQNFHPKVELATKFQCWANRYRKGQYQETHNHAVPDSHFSCNYIHKAPEGSGRLVFVNAVHDYWSASGLTEILDIPYSRKASPELKEGDVVIFPSFLEHFVTPNLTDEPRITFSANFGIGAAKRD